jgi:hypothetical protein
MDEIEEVAKELDKHVVLRVADSDTQRDSEACSAHVSIGSTRFWALSSTLGDRSLELTVGRSGRR